MRRRGFTLVEVILAIVVGIGLLIGTQMLYGQFRKSAGNGNAYKKVMALQALVEELSAASYGTGSAQAFPDLPTLRSAWASKRAEDYLASPWGGSVYPLTDPSGAYAGSPTDGILGNDQQVPGTLNGGTANYVMPTQTNGGILFYYRIVPADGVLDLYDNVTNQLAATYQYAVAVCDNNGVLYDFVRGHFNTGQSVGGTVSSY